MRSGFLTLLLILTAVPCFAAIKNFNLTGSSTAFDIRNGNQAWGVFVGPNDPNATAPFNSCIIDNSSGGVFSFTGCNENRVNGNTVINIQFVEDSDFQGGRPAKAIIRNANNADGSANVDILKDSAPIVFFSNSTANISFTWGELCSKIGGTIQNGSCVDGSSVPISGDVQVELGLAESVGSNVLTSTQIIIFKIYSPTASRGTITFNSSPCDLNDASNNGFCDLVVFPGDEKVFLDDPNLSDRFTRALAGNFSYAKSPSGTDAINYTGIRLYFAESVAELLPINNQYVDFFLDQAGTTQGFDDTKIIGLENDKVYFFRAASIDASGTISQLFDDKYYTLGDCNSATPVNCSFAATPSEVAGIIQESSCFITTIAYGSPMAYQVQVFQNFRESFLRTNKPGRFLIELYENYGPHGALWLKKNPSFIKAARIALQPFYLFASLSFKIGFWSTLMLFFTGLGFVLWSLIYGLKLARIKRA